MLMDPSIVEPAIQEASGGMTGDPRKYLEKIIQVTLMEIVTMRYVCVRFGDVYLRC